MISYEIMKAIIIIMKSNNVKNNNEAHVNGEMKSESENENNGVMKT